MKNGGRSRRFAGHRLALDDWRVGRRRGDFDGDGDLDLVLGSTTGQLEYIKNEGDSWTKEASENFDLGYINLLYKHDFNQNGSQDILISTLSSNVDYVSAYEIKLLLSNGSGEFTSNDRFSSVASEGGIHMNTGDFTADGNQNLLLIDSNYGVDDLYLLSDIYSESPSIDTSLISD